MRIREDLPFVLNKMDLAGTGVEVGTLRGDYASHILRYWNGQKLYCVDAWRHFPGLIDINNPDHNGHLDNMAKSFMQLYSFDERVVLIRELSVEASKLFLDKTLDFVYLDAAHDYESVKKDIEAWMPKIKPGGLLLGHDYIDSPKSENGHTDFGVKTAVDEYAQKLNLKVSCTTQDGDFPTWWFQL